MSGYEYGNTRLRAMKSNLLEKETLESITMSDSLETMITALAKTSYCKAIEAALARTSGLAVIDEALRRDLGETLGKIHRFYQGTAGQNVALLLRAYDVRNMKAVLRGLSQRLPPNEILVAVLAVGDLPERIWTLLAREDGPREAIDTLATLRQPIAEPLLKLRAEKPRATIAEMELSLEKWYFKQAQECLAESANSPGGLIATIRLEADLLNLRTVLRFAHVPAERNRLKNCDLLDLLVDPGEISLQLLELASNQDMLEAAVAKLVDTSYRNALQAGLTAFQETRRLSEFEFYLNLYRLHWMKKQMRLDPLGIGVPIGYLALKTSEVNNLRWIAHGLRQGFDHQVIRAGLEI